MYIPRLAEAIIQQSLVDPKVLIMLGARQVGKTTLIERILADHKGMILNLDIEVDKARFLALSHLSPADAMKNLGSPRLLVIDEAQRLPETARIVKGWFDSKIRTKIILLGSSSLDLLDRSAESLTGRNEKLYLPPLLFTEVLNNQPWYSKEITPPLLREEFSHQVESMIQERLVFGSYPEAIVTPRKQEYLLNLASDYLMKDVFQSALINSPDTLKRLLLLLAYQVGAEVSLNELAVNLHINRATVEKYIDLLERSYVIFRLPAFSSNLRKEIVKTTKIFFWDTGVRNALLNDFNLSPFRSDIGALWENWVIAEFAKQNLLAGNLENLYFWRTSSGSEVDLVMKGSGKFLAYEIKWSNESRSAKRGEAFTNRYQIPVETITRHNVTEFLFSS